MRIATIIARILMGLVFFVFGLNKFLNFIPQPKEAMPADLMTFMNGMIASGYFLKLLGGTEVLAGAMLLANCFVPLALTLLAPIVVNIVCVHAFLAPSGLPVALVVALLEVYLAYAYRKAYAPMLAMRVSPN